MPRPAPFVPFFALAVALGGACGDAGHPSDGEMDSIEKAVIFLANEERAARSLPILYTDERLVRSARAHVELMALRQELNHRLSGEPPLCEAGANNDRYDAVEYPWKWCGENIARGQISAEMVVRDWLASPQHRANILSPEARDIGVARSGVGSWWTQNFGRK